MNIQAELEAALTLVAHRDPEKASYFRWILPNKGEEAVLQMAREFVGATGGANARGQLAGRGATETLLEVEPLYDPDEPTAQFDAFSDEGGEYTEED